MKQYTTLESLAVQWRQSMLAIGQELCRLKEVGENTDIVRSAVLRERYGMPMAQSAVAMRWAAGEFGKNAETIVSKIPAAILYEMPSEVAVSLEEKRHSIQSPTEGRIVSKRLSEMTRAEITHSIDKHGPRTSTKPDRVYRSVVASHVEHDERGVYVVTKGISPLRVKLTAKVLAELEPACV